MTAGTVVQPDPQKARMLTSPWYSFGEQFDSLTIFGRPAPFPVVNDRAVRTTAGIVMVMAAIAMSFAIFQQNYLPVRIVSVVVALDYVLRQVAGLTPLSPIGTLGTFLVSNQRPDWVGATQKRFAWALGFVMALCVAILTNLGIQGPLVLVLGVSFIVLLWLESVVGFCVGCKMYGLLIAADVIHPKDAPACGGGVCEIAPVRA